MVPRVFHAEYVTPLPAGHRFPMGKFAILRDLLVSEGISAAEDFHEPDAATRTQLEAVHAPAYLDAFIAGRLTREQERVMGLPWSEGLVRRTIRAVGGTILTAELALRHGLAANCAGGTHHAHRDFGSGFCILNDLAVAARHLLDHHGLSRVLIIDLDVHQGDGTARIFADEPRVFTLSLHCGKNFPARKARSDVDIDLPKGMNNTAYLALLAEGHADDVVVSGHKATLWRGLDALLEAVEPDAVLYDAGVDVHLDDALGHLALTDPGIYERDRFVIDTCRAQGVPTACVIGGGYDKDWHRLANRHATVHRAAHDHAQCRHPSAARVG